MVLKHIDVDSTPDGGQILLSSKLIAIASCGRECEEILFDVNELLDTAKTLFLGHCPAYTPYFIWGEMYPLPWGNRYFIKDGEKVRPIEIKKEVNDFLQVLRSLADEHAGGCFPADLPALTWWMQPKISSQQEVQGIAVEAMLALNEVVDALIQGRPYLAMKWLASGYKFLMEAIHVAWPIAEKSNAARIKGARGARGKHAKTDELKAWALEKARGMRYNDRGKARKLAQQIPKHLIGASDDPERFIYDHIRKINKSA